MSIEYVLDGSSKYNVCEHSRVWCVERGLVQIFLFRMEDLIEHCNRCVEARRVFHLLQDWTKYLFIHGKTTFA